MNLKMINEKFGKFGHLIIRMRWLNLIVFVILLAVSFAGMKRIKTDVSDDNWFLENDPMLQKQEEFEDIFGNNDFAAVLIEADDVFNPEVLKGIKKLSDELEAKTPFADEVTSLTHFEFTEGSEYGIEIKDLIPEPIPEDLETLNEIREKALSRKILINRFISDDSRQTWVVLKLTTYPEDWETNEEYKSFITRIVKEDPELYEGITPEKLEAPEIIVGKIFNKITRKDKYKKLNPGTTGMPIMNTERSEYFGTESPRLMKLALLMTIIILALSLKSFRGVIFPIISAAAAMIMVFGFQGFAGITFDPIMIPLPIFLGLAVSIGYSIHIITFFKMALREGKNRKEAAIHSISEAGWPVLFTALTTIGALMSFLFINVRILRWVGLTSAGLVFVTYFLVLILLPSLLSFGKAGSLKVRKRKAENTFVEGLMLKMNDFVMGNQKKIIVTFAVFSIVSIIGLSMVEVSFDIERTMGRGVGYVNRMLDIGDSKVGSIYSYNVMVEFPEYGEAKDPANLRKLDELDKLINSFKLTKKTSSILNIVKDLNLVINDGKDEFHKVPDVNDISEYRNTEMTGDKLKETDKMVLAQTMLLYENAGGSEAEKWMDYDEQRLNIQVELSRYSSSMVVKDFAAIEDTCKDLFPGARVVFAGQVAKYAVMQKKVAWGQIKSFAIALCMIAVLLMLVFGSVRVGLIGMIPNVTPALSVGAVMGFLNIPLDMITVTIMPVLLGLAVDDTIHFINHSQLEFSNTGSYATSIKSTFRTIGTALFMTSLVLVMNFGVYLTSSTKMYLNLGILTCTGIASALIADFLITPVLLQKARVFGNERTAAKVRKVS